VRAARLGVRGRTGLEAADADDLIPGPDSDGEGAGSAVQNSVGAIVERLEKGNDAAMMDPDGGAKRSSAGSLLGSWVLELCLGGEKAGTSKFLKNV
jgi:hypothetical protein